MSWIPIYLDDADVDLIIGWLNADPEIAYIIPRANAERDQGWKAVRQVDRLPDGNNVLWHVPSGPLHRPGHVYLEKGLIIATEEGPVIDNPWAGWVEEGSGVDATVPGLGGSPAVTVTLEIHRQGLDFAERGRKPLREWKRSKDVIGMSAFGWIGNRYRAIGFPASKEAQLWWRRLRWRIAKLAVLIPSTGPLTGPLQMPVFAFPAAYEAIRQGKWRDDNVL